MKLNNLAPAFFHDLGDGRKCHFRADQNAVFELEETTGLPVTAWLTGYGEESVEIVPAREVNGKIKPAVTVSKRSRMLALAWACSRSWRASDDPELTEDEFRSLLPTGPSWEALSGKLERAFVESFRGPEPSPIPAPPEDTAAAPAPAPTGEAGSLPEGFSFT